MNRHPMRRITALVVTALCVSVSTVAVGASPITVPLACSFPGSNPPVNTNIDAVVTVVAPVTVTVGDTYDVTFRVEPQGFSPTPFTVAQLVMTSKFSVSGPVTPNDPLTFTQGPTDYFSGSTVVFDVFTKTFTATATGMVDYVFVDEDWSFTPATAECTPQGVNHVAARTKVEAAVASSSSTTAPTAPTAPAAVAATTSPHFTG